MGEGIVVQVVVVVLVAAGAALLLARRVARTRKTLGQQGLAHRDSWDEMMIKRLRAEGYHPFNEYRVDFFLALRDETTCESVRARLAPEGFAVDVKPIADQSDLTFSLHASKSMRLIVPDIQALSRRMGALAEEFQGRYDHWVA